jgi:hypothetical protein
MQFTLYDYLIVYQYKIVEALKNGFPNSGVYNNWVYYDVLNKLIEWDYNDYSDEDCGIYCLDNYYIGQTRRPIINRVIEHLFETIPIVNPKDHQYNEEKNTCTKINLLMNNKIKVAIYSDDVKEEKEFIECNSEIMALTNIKDNPKPSTCFDYLTQIFEYYDIEEFIDETSLERLNTIDLHMYYTHIQKLRELNKRAIV